MLVVLSTREIFYVFLCVPLWLNYCLFLRVPSCSFVAKLLFTMYNEQRTFPIDTRCRSIGIPKNCSLGQLHSGHSLFDIQFPYNGRQAPIRCTPSAIHCTLYPCRLVFYSELCFLLCIFYFLYFIFYFPRLPAPEYRYPGIP